MKQGLSICFLLLLFSGLIFAQPGNQEDDHHHHHHADTDSSEINSSRTKAYRLTDKLGERYPAPMDTLRLNFSNNILIEGRGLSMSYLGNIGSPVQSRIFSERGEDNNFIFLNAFKTYRITPQNACFYDVKVPYTHLTYLPTLFGNKLNSEELFSGVLTSNFGKKINVGADWEFIFVRGHYASNSNKNFSYRPFANYLSDRYQVHAYFQNYEFLTTENGGITNDRYISHPDDFTEGKRPINDTKSFPTRFTDTWNHIKGKQLFLTHRYNLGFYRELTTDEKEEAERKKEERKKNLELQQHEASINRANNRNENATQQSGFSDSSDEEQGIAEEKEEVVAVFVPVASIIHTIEHESMNRFFTSNSRGIDTCYSQIHTIADSIRDFTEAWNLKNTIGLSLREGFQDWMKFGLTAYVHLDKRRYILPDDSARSTMQYDEFSTYLGAELTKQQGRLLTYNAKGEFCLVGTDIGEFRLAGDLKTQFRLMGKEASVNASGYVKNLRPAFYTRHHHARYFWWDESFNNIQRINVEGGFDIQQTRTQMRVGVESIQNFIYFGKSGKPEQFTSNLQVVTARFKQDFRYKAFGWENEVAYQLSSNKNVLPLPAISAYTNLYLDFKYAKVMDIQLGIDAHYFTSYFAPYYEPATQQFQIQEEKKIGNYPIINAYVNFNLKQARFFISGYNLSSLFITPTEYFSLLHYPLNPQLIKAGISFYLNN